MDRKTKQSLLCALEEKLISVRRILKELGDTSPLPALEKLQTFCREETAKLILDVQRAKALPFLNLTAENESTRRALTACQSDLQTKLEHLTSGDDIETLLVPYQKFVALLQSDNPSTKLNSIVELQRYFPDELIFAALQVQKSSSPPRWQIRHPQRRQKQEAQRPNPLFPLHPPRTKIATRQKQ